MSHISRLALATVSFIAAISASVAQASGWEWPEELQQRTWGPWNLSWTSSIDPQHPSWLWLQQNEAPPPREMWCRYNTTPTQADCNAHFNLMQSWVDAYFGEHVPFAELDYTPECASSCYP